MQANLCCNWLTLFKLAIYFPTFWHQSVTLFYLATYLFPWFKLSFTLNFLSISFYLFHLSLSLIHWLFIPFLLTCTSATFCFCLFYKIFLPSFHDLLHVFKLKKTKIWAVTWDGCFIFMSRKKVNIVKQNKQKQKKKMKKKKKKMYHQIPDSLLLL